jgi:hypothetical protein
VYARTATLKRAERYTFFRIVGALDGQRVLDLACGFGNYTRRFLRGNDYDAVPRQAMVESLDPYASAGKIVMPLMHKHFMVRRHM